MLLDGLQLPLTTPFYPDGRLNLLKLEHNVARYSKAPVSGLVALSEFGEQTMLSDDETREVLRIVVGAAGAEKVLVAGVSRDSVAGTLDITESAAKCGYDAVLVKRPSVLPGVGRRGTKELVTYFQAVADRAALPVVLYDSGSEELLPVEVTIELAGHPQVIGLVECAGGRERFAALSAGTAGVKRRVEVTAVFAAVTGRMRVHDEDAAGGLIAADSLTGGAGVAVAPVKPAVKTRTKLAGFQILSGRTTGVLEGLRAGAVGAMPGFAASAPQACYEVLAAWKDGDEGLAEEKQIRLDHIVQRVEEELGVAGIKFGCDLNGYFGGNPRLPLLPLKGDERAEIESLMQGLRN
ncbi:MAG: dihydrodipicolinate synthase family protein [Edaphobacter sp.]